MKNNEKGFLEGLAEGIGKTIDMKRAIERSRDENGRVDKWKATAICMGRGFTSDEDMARLAGLLGAEGAFDSDNDD